MYTLKLEDFGDKKKLYETEYLLTNGIGGYASSTVMGRHTRKYHGVLVASFNPPVERFMTLSKMVERVMVNNTEFHLNNYNSKTLKTSETDCLKYFVKDFGVHWFYELKSGIKLKKSLYLLQGENTAIISYELESESSGTLKLSPELSIRDHHEVSYVTDMQPTWRGNAMKAKIKSPALPNGLSFSVTQRTEFDNGIEITPVEQWVGPYFLANEAERGLQEETMAYVPFEWTIAFEAGKPLLFDICVSTEAQMPVASTTQLIEGVRAHYEHIIEQGSSKGAALTSELKAAQKALLVAASDFIVTRKSTGKSTILAGYPWFTDWGRDSMISLSGLTLSAGRPDLFREIYETFERYMKDGILPNVFPDAGDEPRYNTVDATLWMPIAMFRYYEETKDIAYVKSHFLPTLESIIRHYQKGTLNNTYMDTDGLIWSGDENTQLTWMDVKVNGWVVTPRHGKAVEINALWYNTLKIGEYFKTLCLESNQEIVSKVTETNLKATIELWRSLAARVKHSFEHVFWNEEKKYLNDVVREETYLTCIRPNQIFALSLPYALIEEKRAQNVLEVVKLHLWMPYGLRSLSPTDHEYHGYYGGDVLARDGAYHRGTGWGWLIGPYLDAYYRVKVESGEDEATVFEAIESMVVGACSHLSEVCLGQYCENFDGDEPHHGRGCMAQAWSVAELLRWVTKINEFKLRRASQ